MLSAFKHLFFASRPKTLVAGMCPVILGAVFAFQLAGPFDFFYFWILVLSSVCIQIATNFFNDALDSDHGRDSEARLGPKRAVATGALSSSFLKRVALGLLGLSLALGLVLALKVGFWIFLIGLPALLLAYLYTGSKYALSTTGTADFFVVLYFGVIPVWTTCYVLSGLRSFDAALVGLAVGFLANALLVINNLRDLEEDMAGNKKTLIVRFGRKFGLVFLGLCLFSPYGLLFAINEVYFRAGLWSLLLLPLSLFVFLKVLKNQPSQKYNKHLGLTALNLMLFSYLVSIGVLSS